MYTEYFTDGYETISYNNLCPHLFYSNFLHIFWRNKNMGWGHGSNINSSNIHQFLSESSILCFIFKVSGRI